MLIRLFLQPDPIHFGGGDFNLYRYCHNDPINLVDPFGLLPPDVIVLAERGMEKHLPAVTGAVENALNTSTGQRMMISATYSGVSPTNPIFIWISRRGEDRTTKKGAGDIYINPERRVPILYVDGTIGVMSLGRKVLQKPKKGSG